MPSTATDRLGGLTTSVAVKAPCRVATTANLGSRAGLLTIDGVTVAAGDRVLVKDQTAASENGIYVAGTAAWERALDFNGSLDAVGGTQVVVVSGTANGNSYWRVSGSGAVVIGTDSISFTPAFIDDSASATFLQSGNGAVPRTAQAKLREFASAEDFGAVGDGATNDTTALQRLLDSGFTFVRLKDGKTYRTTSVLTVPTGVFIDASGATIDVDHNGKGLTFTSGGGITGGAITGPGGTTYLEGSIGIWCTGTNNSPAAPTYTTGPAIVGTEVSGFREYGIVFEFAQNFVIERAYVHDCVYGGIAGGSCSDVLVLAPRVYDITAGSPDDAYGIVFDRRGELVGSETSHPRSYRIQIVAPDIQRVTTADGTGQGINSHAGVDIVVLGGQILDCDMGGSFVFSNVGGAQTLGPIRCKVIGTTIKGGYDSVGFYISGALNGSTVVEYAQDCELNGVTIDGHGIDNTTGSAGVVIQGTKNAQIIGCNLKNNRRNSLFINLANIGFNVSGCIFTDPHDTTFTAPSCIAIFGNNNSGFIGGNTFRYEVAALATYVAVNAVRIEATLTGLGIEFGRHAFVGIDGSHLAYTELTSAGVNASDLYGADGASALVAGTKVITFGQRFPSSPKVFVQIEDDINPIRVSAKSATGFTATGTGTTSFSWFATT